MTVPLVLLGSALAWAALFYGGVTPQWNISLLLIASGGLAWWLPQRRVPNTRQDRWLDLALLAFLAYVAFQLLPLPISLLRLLSPERAAVLQALSAVQLPVRWAPVSVMPWATWTHLLRIAGYAVAFLTIRSMARQVAANAWSILLPPLIVGALEAGLGLIQSIAGDAHGTYVDRNHFAGLLEMLVPFAAAWGLAEWSDRSRTRAYLLFVAAVVMFVAIVLSLSRTGLLAASCALAIVFLAAFRDAYNIRWIAGILVALAIGGAIALPTRMMNRIAEVANTPEAVTSDRAAMWSETARIVQAYPLTGCGLGTRAYTYFKYKTEFNYWTSDFAHNDYLQGFAELGIAGFGILSIFISRLSMHAFRAARLWMMGLAGAAALVAIAIHSFDEFNLYIPANALLLAWIAGAVTGLAERENEPLTVQ